MPGGLSTRLMHHENRHANPAAPDEPLPTRMQVAHPPTRGDDEDPSATPPLRRLRADDGDGRKIPKRGNDRPELRQVPQMHDPLPSEVRRPDWRGTRVACGSLVALRRRLSPGLPLSRSL